MKKKLIYCGLAAALIAVNVLSFSAFARLPERSDKPGKPTPYQTMSYCHPNSLYSLNYSCVAFKTDVDCNIDCYGRVYYHVPTDPTIVSE